ncbi:MAG: ABC transporter substrate-binding protein [Gammaproteobacteria bacterium]|nr:ABC transporter substrate-binding protein [Gammaproteobacteria bacterium]
MKTLLRVVIVLILSISAQASIGSSPETLVKNTTDQVLGELKSNREVLLKDQGKLYALVDKIVLPHFDFERMSRLVLGKYWQRATDEQRSKFIGEFKDLLVRTYATALFEYTNQRILYKPFRMQEGNKRAVVKTEIELGDAPNVPLNYSLRQNDGGLWKVYDITIDGISLVTNYRLAYSRTIQTEGLDALIRSLGERNQSLNAK